MSFFNLNRAKSGFRPTSWVELDFHLNVNAVNESRNIILASSRGQFSGRQTAKALHRVHFNHVYKAFTLFRTIEDTERLNKMKTPCPALSWTNFTMRQSGFGGQQRYWIEHWQVCAITKSGLNISGLKSIQIDFPQSEQGLTVQASDTSIAKHNYLRVSNPIVDHVDCQQPTGQ